MEEVGGKIYKKKNMGKKMNIERGEEWNPRFEKRKRWWEDLVE